MALLSPPKVFSHRFCFAEMKMALQISTVNDILLHKVKLDTVQYCTVVERRLGSLKNAINLGTKIHCSTFAQKFSDMNISTNCRCNLYISSYTLYFNVLYSLFENANL